MSPADVVAGQVGATRRLAQPAPERDRYWTEN